MASNHFSISPSTGIDNGTVIVTPLSTNDTQDDKIATVTIASEGLSPVNVTVNHWGMPSIGIVGGSEPVSAPSSGAIYQFLVKTHYAVQFYNKPDWVQIDDGQGNYISSAQTVSANVANGHTYNFTVLPNTTNNSRSTSNFGLYHLVNGVRQNSFDEVSITQPQGASDYIVISPTSMLDWDDTNAKSITINANVSYSVSHSNTTDFTLAGGNGYVTIRANANNTGNVLKTDTISVVSTKEGFAYTATCVVTQVRQPRIQLNSSGTINPTGGTGSVWVASDYYWWIQPPVYPDNASSYITMEGKTAGTNLEPTDGSAYTLTWTSNDGNIRNDSLYVGYNKTDGTTGQSSSYANFTQDRASTTALTVNPSRVPSTGYVDSGGGVYVVEVITDRPWKLNNTPLVCTVSPTSASAGTNVTITVPQATHTSSAYSLVDHIYFVTNDGGQIASDDVAVWQYDNYPADNYITITPSAGTANSGSSVLYGQVKVSASTDWTITYNVPWFRLYDAQFNGNIVESGVAGETTIYRRTVTNSGGTRTGTATFTAGNASATYTLSQSAAGWTASPSEFSGNTAIPAQSSSITNKVFLTTPAPWTAQTSYDWIHIVFQDMQSREIDFYCDNNSGSARDGSIEIVSGGNTVLTIPIHQLAAE